MSDMIVSQHNTPTRLRMAKLLFCVPLFSLLRQIRTIGMKYDRAQVEYLRFVCSGERGRMRNDDEHKCGRGKQKHVEQETANKEYGSQFE